MTESYSIEFNEIARQEAMALGLEDLDARKFMTRLSRDNVAQMVVLESLASRQNPSQRGRVATCVVNTHLYSNVMRTDVKLWQTKQLMAEVSFLRALVKSEKL